MRISRVPAAVVVVLATLLSTAAFADCPQGEKACGKACYNPIRSQCLEGVVCGNGDRVCGGQCYDPVRSHCLNGVLCAMNEQVCKGECYDPSRTTCK